MVLGIRGRRPAMLISSLRPDRQAGCGPRVEAALEVGHPSEAERPEQRRGDGGPVPAGAVDDGGRAGIQLAVMRRAVGRAASVARRGSPPIPARPGCGHRRSGAPARRRARPLDRARPDRVARTARSGRSASSRSTSTRAPCDTVEADARQADLRLGLASLVGDDDDRLARPRDVAGVLGEATVEPDVHRAAEVARRERLGRCARRSPRRPPAGSARGRRSSSRAAGFGVVEEVVHPPVAVGREREVQRRDRLALGDHRRRTRPRSSGAARS